jgi:hypothetical protein
MKCKSIEAFVRHTIRAGNTAPDIAELQRLLDKINTDEMQRFWMHFTASRAYSAATTAAPDWSPKEQMTRLQHEHLSWIFQPNEKDANGKYVTIRKDLEEHIKTCLLRHIENERILHKDRSNQPLLNRINHVIAVSVFIMAVPFCICLFLPQQNIAVKTIELLFASQWGLYLFTGVLIVYFRRSQSGRDLLSPNRH